MNGPEHYREAEKLLTDAAGLVEGGLTRAEASARAAALPIILALAQVHATLALTAATALPADYVGAVEARLADWSEVAR